jgi:isoleucyl-tRNA synthetase
MTPENKKSYKDTLNLPVTTFPMEAKLVTNEPVRLKKWQDSRLYDRILASRQTCEKWILHDGPPFANSDIHLGHVGNKTLKDVFIRFKTLQGYCAPYVPGWDCHGLPIEHKVQQDLGSKLREMDVVEIRKRCFDHAMRFVNIQSQQFQRLGVLGDWEHPYLTMSPEYEAATLNVFSDFVRAGLVYRQLKPVHWSIANQTALADAELEYKDVEEDSIFVEFPVANPGLFKSKFDLRVNASCSLLIWTTTPWTLPANLAIAVHPDVEYALVKYKRNESWRISVVAADLVKRVFDGRSGVSEVEVLKTTTGRDLVGVEYRHAFLDRTAKVLPALYVTTTDGTGLVHTAPGHGEDDYATGVANGLEVYCPVLANGRFDSTTPNWLTGLTVWEANPKVVEKLRELDATFAVERISHSYPHDWRSKTPTIFRATEQWFIAIDKPFILPMERRAPISLRDRAREAINEQVTWVPEWGRARILGMIESRPDWCVSRQRAWGLPIPVFYNEQGEALITPESVQAVARTFAREGSNAWFTASPAELLGDFDPGARFPKETLRKEKDIFDVWFESGSSWNAVLRARTDLSYPADLYLEGSDQHRGWFQLSLLPSLGTQGTPPFKTVLTHGFFVGPDGKKVSKSSANYVTATEEVNRHGADLLRLFTGSLNYEGDMPASPQMIREFGDKYRKIRNTLRYLLSNLSDFDPAHHSQEVPLQSLDGWASHSLDVLIRDVTDAYDRFALHRAFRLLHDFCAVQISSLYGNAMKDRLYCEAPDAASRRRCQTVMYRMVIALTKLISPMLVFTADEAWEHITHKPAGEESCDSVHLTRLPLPILGDVSEEQQEEWRLLMQLRDDALIQLDRLKKEAGMNKALDAEIVYHVDDDALRQRLQHYGADLEDIVGCGSWSFAEGDVADPAARVTLHDRREKYAACARSWKRHADVGTDSAYPDLSLRDAQVMKNRRT